MLRENGAWIVTDDGAATADEHLRRSEVKRESSQAADSTPVLGTPAVRSGLQAGWRGSFRVLVHRIWGLVAETASRVRSGAAVGASCMCPGAIHWQKLALVRAVGPRLTARAAPRGAARAHTRGRFCHQPSQSVSHSPQTRRRSTYWKVPTVSEERNRDF